MEIKMLRSKTIAFSVLLAVLGVLEQSQGVVTQIVGASNVGAVMVAISVAVAVLRVYTTLPLSEK